MEERNCMKSNMHVDFDDHVINMMMAVQLKYFFTSFWNQLPSELLTDADKYMA